MSPAEDAPAPVVRPRTNEQPGFAPLEPLAGPVVWTTCPDCGHPHMCGRLGP